MARVTGLGGVFIKSPDPKALAAWYEQKLGVGFGGKAYVDLPFTEADGSVSKGSNVLSFFPETTPYFAPSEQRIMLNLRVEGLEEFLEELKGKGIKLEGEPMIEAYGKFAWILDLDGNKVELWEAPAE